MAEHESLRPVSGEIVSRAAARQAQSASAANIAAADIVDAEFEVVGVAGNGDSFDGGGCSHRHATTGSDAPHTGMDVLRHTGASAAKKPAFMARAPFWIFGVIVVLTAFWASGGHALFGSVFALSPHGNAVPTLRVDDLRSRLQMAQGRRWLLVEGAVVNPGHAGAPAAPVLLFSINGKDGKTRRHLLDTGTERIAPGESLAFASRLEAPLSGVASLSVTIQEGNVE